MNLITDYATAQASLVPEYGIKAPQAVTTEPIAKQGRGRPKTIFKNPAAAFMPFLVIPDPLPWGDDIIHGSILTSAGRSNGKTRAVIGALFLSEISADVCKIDETTLHTAQRIAKAARHAARGIASYVERHPRLKAELEVELDAEAQFRASQT